MRQSRFDRALRKAETITQNPENYTSRGKLKARKEKQVSKLVTRITFLSQFEKQENFNY